MAKTDAPYQQSRSALRRIYGTRAINASAPQSAADTTPSGRVARETGIRDLTPSGRMRSFRERGMGEDEAQVRDDRYWMQQFGGGESQDTLASTRPIDMLRLKARVSSPLDAMEQFNQGNLPVGFSRPVSTPANPPGNMFASVDNYLGTIGGASPSSLFPSLRRRASRSILDDADAWRQSV